MGGWEGNQELDRAGVEREPKRVWLTRGAEGQWMLHNQTEVRHLSVNYIQINLVVLS